jgi:hypothetical protein
MQCTFHDAIPPIDFTELVKRSCVCEIGEYRMKELTEESAF